MMKIKNKLFNEYLQEIMLDMIYDDYDDGLWCLPDPNSININADILGIEVPDFIDELVVYMVDELNIMKVDGDEYDTKMQEVIDNALKRYLFKKNIEKEEMLSESIKNITR